MKMARLIAPVVFALALAAAGPAAAVITIDVGDATANPGGAATFAVTLSGIADGGVAANNAQVDVIFDLAVLEVPGSAGSACIVASRYEAAQGFSHTESFPASPAVPEGKKRLRLNVIDTTDPLGGVVDGDYYVCTFAVKADAPLGQYTLEATRLNVGDVSGGVLASAGSNGTLTIEPVPPTNTPVPTATETPVPPATNTPPPTNTKPPATATRTAPPGGGDDDGGCHVATRSSGGSTWLLLLPAALWFAVSRRKKSA